MSDRPDRRTLRGWGARKAHRQRALCNRRFVAPAVRQEAQRMYDMAANRLLASGYNRAGVRRRLEGGNL